jgi:hypothetical protein
MPNQTRPAREPKPPANEAQPPVRDIDPFDDVEALRLSPDASTVAVRKIITRVPVRKPNNQEFFRVHPDERYRLDTGIIDLRDDRESYLIHPQLREELADEIRAVRLYICISRAGAVFLWAVPLPGPDGRRNGWHDSAHAAAELAMEQWTRIKSDMSAGQYETSVAAAEIPDPEWPGLSFNELLRLAFKDAFIDSIDHPVVQRLRGLR